MLQLQGPLLDPFGLAAILNEMQSLEILVLSGDIDEDSNWSGIRSIELPALKYLSFQSSDHFQLFCGLLKLLKSANLKTICLDLMVNSDFQDFLQESNHPAMQHSIQKLHISTVNEHHGTYFRTDIWNALMCAFPDVTHLDICNGLARPFLRALQINSINSKNSRWKRLNTVEICHEHSPPLAWQVIKDIVSKHYVSQHPLQRLLLPEPYLADPGRSEELFWVERMVKVDASLRKRSALDLTEWPGGPVEEYF